MRNQAIIHPSITLTAFVEDYQDENDEDKLFESLGMAIAKYCTWTGEDIMKIFSAALEDANYHPCAAVVNNWIAGETP